MTKLVVVTGASSGIGAATARRFAQRGARVVMLARRQERLGALADEIGGAAYAVDLADADATSKVCAQILADEGTPDVVLNNAGAGRFLSIEQTSFAEAERQIQVPYLAAFRVTRAFIEPMLARGSGVVFQINTPAAIVPWPGAVGYSAARFAMRGFTEALRQDLWQTGVQVGALYPTRVSSDYFEVNPGARDRIPTAEALVGAMTPDQVAAAVEKAVIYRPNQDTYVPWRWALMAPIARAIPAPVRWLYRLTGHKRH